MEVQQHTVTPIPALSDNYIWAILSGDSRYCVVVDPGDATPVLTFLQKHNLELSAILLTHHHWDHTNGVMELVRKHPNTMVYGPAIEPVGGMTHQLNAGDTLTLPDIDLTLEVFHIPGHTLGHIAFYGDGLLFCGDTLFTAGCGKIFEGTPEQMYQSLSTLANLPDDTQIYCGHEYTEKNLQFASAVEPNNQDIKKRIESVQQQRQQGLPTVPASLTIEKQTNPFLRTQQTNVIKAAERYAEHSMHTDAEVLQTLREWKNQEY